VPHRLLEEEEVPAFHGGSCMEATMLPYHLEDTVFSGVFTFLS